jgi:hypothetical protein
MHPIAVVACDLEHGILEADGAVAMIGLQPADACGATDLRSGDIYTLAIRNRLPRAPATQDDGARAEAALKVTLTAALSAPAELEFRAPLQAQYSRAQALADAQRTSFADARARVATAWRALVGRVSLDVGDPRVNAAFRSAQVTLLQNRNGPLPRSGPLAHDAFWVRDAAYIGEALERVGDGRDNEATLNALLALQRDDGSFPAITDASRPRPVDEWDSAGQAIASVVSHYRFSHDRAWLERAYPALRRAAFSLTHCADAR